MSKATKRKHVAREVLDDYVLPEGNQQIVKVTSSKGNNLHEVETCTGERYLASMPTKYRKNVWIKRGDFVLVEPIGEGDKVKAEIVFVLYKDQIKYIKDERKWPKEFDTKSKEKCEATIPDDMLPPSSDSDEEFYDDLVLNVNRVQMNYVESEDDSDELEEPHVVNGGTH